MTEIKDEALALWIREMMVNKEITICPRCQENLIASKPYNYLVNKGIQEGRARDICRGLENKGISRRFHVGSGRENGDFICQECISEYDNKKETYKDWPIEEGE